MWRLRPLVALLFLFVCRSVPVCAQAADEVVKIESALVSVNVSVTDKKGRYVSGLAEGDFLLSDNGRQVGLEFFDRYKAASVVFVLDASSSMSGLKWKTLKQGLRKFLSTAQPDNDYSLVTFNDKARLLARGVGAEAFWLRFQTVQPYGETALYDGVLLGLEALRTCKRRQKALILLSDGGDNRSIARLSEVEREVVAFRATIYPVGVLERDSYGKVHEIDRAGFDRISQLANVTGGIASFPKYERTGEALMEIHKDISSQYTLSYYSPDEAAGWREVQVAVPADPNLRLRYQSKYRKH